MMPSTEVADEVWTDDAQASVAVPSHSTWVADELRLEALARQAGWTPLSASSPRDIEEPLGLSGWSDVIRLLDPRHRAPSGLSAAAYAERRAMRRSLSGMGAAILALHVLGWGILLVMVLGHRDGAATTFFGLGLGATVYALGLRHAFDADHIAAIDNTTRKLVQDGQRPLSVGFWFSLGHSTVVFVVCLLLSLGVRALAGQLGDGSQLRDVFGVVGTIVSSVFLLVLAVINLFSFAGTLRLAGRVRGGAEVDPATLGTQGVLTRLVGGRLRAITRPWHIYPVGVLFGLGFDTATEVGLLALTGGAAALALPWYAILSLPLIFAAGMSLFDTLDGTFMNYVYRWAFNQPLRKLYYNLVVTGVSIVFALGIGTVEASSLLADKLAITTGPLAALGSLDLTHVGFFLVGGFAVVALIVFWRSHRQTAKLTQPRSRD